MLEHMPGATRLSAADGRQAVEAALRAGGYVPDNGILDQSLMFGEPPHYGDVLVLPGEASVPGDVLLDWRTQNPQPYRGIVAPQGLNMIGDLVNENFDGGPFLLVCGPLSGRNLFKRGAPVIVLGPLRVRGHVLAEYNHGLFHVLGDISAQGVVLLDHWWRIDGDVDAPMYTDAVWEPAGVLHEDLLEPNPDDLHLLEGVDDLTEKIRARMVAGEPVFCSTAPRGKPE